MVWLPHDDYPQHTNERGKGGGGKKERIVCDHRQTQTEPQWNVRERAREQENGEREGAERRRQSARVQLPWMMTEQRGLEREVGHRGRPGRGRQGKGGEAKDERVVNL